MRETVTVVVDGRRRQVPAGCSVAAALITSGTWTFRHDLVTGEPRGPFCGIGACFECELTVDGRPATRACLEHVTDGMTVDTGGRTT